VINELIQENVKFTYVELNAMKLINPKVRGPLFVSLLLSYPLRPTLVGFCSCLEENKPWFESDS